jgi:hypothetical protein
MKRKRLSRVRAKPNSIRMKYGLDYDGERGHVIAHGDGCNRGDAWVMVEVLDVLGRKREPFILSDDKSPRESLLEELERHGFDVKTLEITIQKKQS